MTDDYDLNLSMNLDPKNGHFKQFKTNKLHKPKSIKPLIFKEFLCLIPTHIVTVNFHITCDSYRYFILFKFRKNMNFYSVFVL